MTVNVMNKLAICGIFAICGTEPCNLWNIYLLTKVFSPKKSEQFLNQTGVFLFCPKIIFLNLYDQFFMPKWVDKYLTKQEFLPQLANSIQIYTRPGI